MAVGAELGASVRSPTAMGARVAGMGAGLGLQVSSPGYSAMCRRVTTGASPKYSVQWLRAFENKVPREECSTTGAKGVEMT